MQKLDGTMHLTAIQLPFGDFSGYQNSGMRFEGVSGLSGVTIDSATLTFMAQTGGTVDFVGTFYGQDAAAPGTFTTTAYNITDTGQRPRTTALCGADGVDFGDWVNGENYEYTGDGVNTIAEIIQELADGYDPSTIVLLWIYTSGTGARIARSYNFSSVTAPKLDIDYTAAAGGVTVFAALATATALSPVATVTTGLVVAAALATATALALAAKHVNSIPAAVATATAKSYEATVSGAALVAAALATATAKSYGATISGAALIAGALATATAKSLAATVSGVTVVKGALATATAKSYAAGVTGAALIGAALSTATAKSYAAAINPGATIAGALATATARALAAVRVGEEGVRHFLRRWYR